MKNLVLLLLILIFLSSCSSIKQLDPGHTRNAIIIKDDSLVTISVPFRTLVSQILKDIECFKYPANKYYYSMLNNVIKKYHALDSNLDSNKRLFVNNKSVINILNIYKDMERSVYEGFIDSYIGDFLSEGECLVFNKKANKYMEKISREEKYFSLGGEGHVNIFYYMDGILFFTDVPF